MNSIPTGVKSYTAAARVICKNGFSVSIQGSHYSYCKPREDFERWYQVELGFPSKECPELMEWCDEPKNPTDTVYGYVPIEVVKDLLIANGAPDFGKMSEPENDPGVYKRKFILELLGFKDPSDV